MSASGAKYLVVHPFSIGLRERTKMLGADSTLIPDYGVEARAAAVERGQQERLNRAYDAQDAQQRAFERQQVLDVAQQAVVRASRSQTNIMVGGANQFRKLLFAGSVIAALALGTLAVASVFGKTNRKQGKRSRSKKRSRFKKRSASFSPRISESPALSKGLLS